MNNSMVNCQTEVHVIVMHYERVFPLYPSRVVSQEENDRVLHENQQLMTRYMCRQTTLEYLMQCLSAHDFFRLTSITELQRQDSVNGFSHQQLARNDGYVVSEYLFEESS